jgi:hypothetical protein
MQEDLALLITFCLVGLFGDAILQLLARHKNVAGLQGYFKQHGSGESICIAAGMLTIFFIVYRFVLHLPVKWYYLALYGIILDFIFRKFNIFPSLKGYYEHMNYFSSALWGAIPMILPLAIYSLIKWITRK